MAPANHADVIADALDERAFGRLPTQSMREGRRSPIQPKRTYINRVAVSSTMGPGVKVEPSSLFGEAAH
jgi:hypothetical protein